MNDVLLLSSTATFCYLISTLAVIYANSKFSSGVFKSAMTILSAAMVLLLYVALLNLIQVFYAELDAVLLPMRLGVLVLSSVLFVFFGRKLLEMSDLFGLAKLKPQKSPEEEQRTHQNEGTTP